MRNAIALIFVGLLLSAGSAAAEPLFIEKSYDGFSVVIDCRQNGPIVYEMELPADQGNEPRLDDFILDSTIPADCQMTTGDTFKVTDAEESHLGRYHRGHLADANSLDSRRSPSLTPSS